MNDRRTDRRKPSHWLRLGIIGGVCLGLLGATWLLAAWYVNANATSTLKTAEGFLDKQDTDAVRRSLSWLLFFEPQNRGAQLLQGMSYHMDSRFDEAIRVFEQIPERSREFEDANFALAVTLKLDLQLDRAEQVLRNLLRRFPRSDAARQELVLLYMKEFRKRDAIEVLMDRWRSDPSDLSVLPDLLRFHMEMNTPQADALYLEQADQQHPGQPAVILALAHAYWKMGRIDDAQDYFLKALDKNAGDSSALLLAAEFYVDTGRFDDAERLLGEANSSQAPDYAGTGNEDRYRALRAKLSEVKGDLKRAFEEADRATKLRPYDKDYLSQKARLLRRLGRSVEAESVAQRLVDMEAAYWSFVTGKEPDFQNLSPERCREIAEIMERLGHSDQAAGWRIVADNFSSRADGRPPAELAP